MPYSVAEKMCMVDLYLKGLTATDRRKAFCQLYPKAEVPTTRVFLHWVKVWRESGSVESNERRHRSRSVLTDEKLADISELLRKNPRLSLRHLAVQAGISLTSAFQANRMLKVRSDEESAANDFRTDDTNQNDFFGTMSSEFNLNEEEEKTKESGKDSFSSVWVKVEKEDPDEDLLMEATSTCTEEDSLLTCNSGQSSREAEENVQETSLHTVEKGLLRLVKSNKSYTCNVCGRVFENQHEMHEHMCKHTQERPYVCKFCNKAFARKDGIINHLWTHTGKTSYDCGLCTISFKTKDDKKIHMELHKERPYACKFCSKAFARKDGVLNHLWTHTVKRSSRSKLCDKSFKKGEEDKKKDSKKKRMALHKEKPTHVCEICGKSFAFMQHLNTHKKAHIEGKPYFCEICSKSFNQKKNMWKHLESHVEVIASENSDIDCDDNYLQRETKRMSSNEIDSSVVSNDSASDSIIEMEFIAHEYLQQQANKRLKEIAEKRDSAQGSFNMASRNASDESYVGAEEHEFEDPLMVEKEKNALPVPDQNLLQAASTNCSQDFTFIGISGENMKVKDKSDPPEEEIDFSKVIVKVEIEDDPPDSEEYLIPDTNFNCTNNIAFACKKEQPYEEGDECCDE